MVKLFRNVLKKIKISTCWKTACSKETEKCNEKKGSLLLGQMYIQHLLVRSPSHIDHQDRTTKDHTWDPHGELLEHDQNYVYYQGFQWKGIIHHGDKISLTQPSKRTYGNCKFWTLNTNIVLNRLNILLTNIYLFHLQTPIIPSTHQCRQWKIVKQICKCLPNIGIAISAKNTTEIIICANLQIKKLLTYLNNIKIWTELQKFSGNERTHH